ncbi:MAG: hypothetical protein C4341_04840 [Armatimonadota bacterium]
MRIPSISPYEPVLALLRQASDRLQQAVTAVAREGDVLKAVVSMNRASLEARLGELLFREVARNERTVLDIVV